MESLSFDEALNFLPLDADMVITIDTVLQTSGAGPYDFECPICRVPFGQESDTLEHAQCHRRFDYECLREWIESLWQPTCPFCRAPLVDPKAEEARYLWSEQRELESLGYEPEEEALQEPEDEAVQEPMEEAVQRPMEEALEVPWLPYEEIWEMRPGARAAYIRDFRQSAPTITEWHIVSCERQLLDHLTRSFPLEDPVRLSDVVKQEMKLSFDILDSTGSTDAIGLVHSASLVRECHSYGFDSEEIQYLWTATMIFGVSHWFKLLLSSPVRSIAFWLPMHEPIRPLRSEGELQRHLGLQTHQRLVNKSLSSNPVLLPLPTSLIVKHLGWLDQEYQEEAHQNLRLLQQTAHEMNITHWALTAVPWSALSSSPPVFAIPWPRSGLEAGHVTLTYPGWITRSPDFHTRPGWSRELSRSCYHSFLEERRMALDEFLEAESNKEREECEKEAATSLLTLATGIRQEESSAEAERSIGRVESLRSRQLYANPGWYSSGVEQSQASAEDTLNHANART